jgi:tryptophan 2,3-dioxygenase
MTGNIAAPRVLEATPYDEYGGIGTLHALCEPRTEVPAERSFIVATQVMELLFGQLRHEWEQAQRALRADDLPAAMDALRRGTKVQDVLVASWDLLATLTPMEFSAFRDALGPASGVQSTAYRRLEFLLGNKSPGMARTHPGLALEEPSLYDDVLAVLDRRGLLAFAPCADTPHSGRYKESPEVEKAWLLVYTSPECADLARLGEVLLDTAERVTRWRQRHYGAVRRAMGAKPGTGGSSGLSWLRAAVDQEVFPELWSVRNEL